MYPSQTVKKPPQKTVTTRWGYFRALLFYIFLLTLNVNILFIISSIETWNSNQTRAGPENESWWYSVTTSAATSQSLFDKHATFAKCRLTHFQHNGWNLTSEIQLDTCSSVQMMLVSKCDCIHHYHFHSCNYLEMVYLVRSMNIWGRLVKAGLTLSLG
jgi:hypothetical protein